MLKQHQLDVFRIFPQGVGSVNMRASTHIIRGLMKTSLSRRSLLQLSGATAAAGLLELGMGNTTFAQAAASPALRILCTGPAGSIPDVVARRVAEQLAPQYPQGLVVENRPGAAGQIAVNALKASPADGFTLLLAQGAVATVYPYLYTKLAYDPIADLQPVSLASETPLALAIGPAVPSTVTSIPALINWMRSNPHLANVGSPGTGTLPHLLQAMLFSKADVPWQHVVYAGGPPAIVDLLGGQIAVLSLPGGILRQHKATGKLRVLATSGAQRSAYFSDVPTFTEQGFHELIVREWFAFFMPARVTPELIASTSHTLRQAIARPELLAAFAESGMTAAGSTPAALAATIAAEQRYWQPILRNMNLKVD
jgi:tripartite-type tricarboxylate transporter receptor subunit TctC